MKYTKNPSSFDDQITLLESRGMIVSDHDQAHHYLSHLNYYRLSAYWRPFEADHAKHIFKKGTSFEMVLSLYVFDRELRLLLMDAIERIEVSVRTQWAYYLSHSYSGNAILDSRLFRNQKLYQGSLRSLREELDRSHEEFIRHYRSKYSDPYVPPPWMVVEVMSLGQLSKWYSNLKKRQDRQGIAKGYSIDESILVSFLHHLTVIRNICAHHGRLWNRRLGITMQIPRSKPIELLSSFNKEAPRKLYNTMVLCQHLMSVISPNTKWKQRLVKLMGDYPLVNPGELGFPDNWQELPIWERN